jgi:uncharacterized protein (DUF2267 family)
VTSAGEFYRRVARSARLASLEEAAEATRDVLRGIAQVVDGSTRDALCRQLPPELSRDVAGAEGEADPLVDREVFVGRMVSRLDTTHLRDETLGGVDLVAAYADDDAATRARAVFAALREAVDPATAEAVARSLPPEVAGWFRAGGA